MTDAFYLLTGIVLGGTVGLVAGWVIGRTRTAPSDNRLETELRQQLSQKESELAPLRLELGEAVKTRAIAEANQSAAQQMLSEQRVAHDKAMQEAKQTQQNALRICAKLSRH